MAKIRIQRGSGNVFKDLGFPDPEEALLKADLTILISQCVRARGLTQTQAGVVLGIAQSKVSDLLRGRLRGFSVERLFGFLLKLGNDVEISVHERRKRGQLGHLRLSA
jgi:predicted XRE-type DNA-binding protein